MVDRGCTVVFIDEGCSRAYFGVSEMLEILELLLS